MKRRSFIVGLGAASVGGGLTVGSSAFSATDASRNVTVSVKDDSDAYLKLTPNNHDYARKDSNDQIRFSFDDEFEATPGDFGDGVGSDSQYEFHHVFTVENQGTETVRLFGQYEDDDVENIQLMQSTDVNSQDGGKSDPLNEDNRSTPLGSGDQLGIGFLIDTTNIDLGPKETEISIVAASDDSEMY